MPNASLALDQGGNVRGPSKNGGAGGHGMPIGQVLFYHERRLAALESNKSTDGNVLTQVSGAQTTTAIELLSQRLGKVESLLERLQQQLEQQNTIQLEVEEEEEEEEEEES